MRTIEEAVLIAALEEDRDGLLKKLKDLLPGERRALERACGLIQETIREELTVWWEPNERR